MKFEYIYINIDDDVSQVVEKILDSKGENIILFIPDGAEIAMSVSSFKLVAREAEAAKKKVFINSDEETVIKMAEKAGIEVVEYEERKTMERKGPSFIMDITPPQREEKQQRLQSKPMAAKNLKLSPLAKKSEVEAEEEDFRVPVSSNIKKENDFAKREERKERREKREEGRIKKYFNNSFRSKKIVGIVVAAIVVIFIPFLFFSRAEVKVITKKYNYNSQSPVLASIAISANDQANFKIPAQYLNFDKEVKKQFEATGSGEGGGKSSGTIKIYNNYNSQPQTLVATTRFLSESGKLFRLVKTTTVPGAKIQSEKITPSFVEAQVIADQGGEDFNIGPSKFSIPGFKGTVRDGKFYGESSKAMTGGSSGKTKVVSAEDLKKAKDELAAVAKVALEEEMKSKLPEGLKILEDTNIFEVKKADFSAKEGEQKDSFECTVNASLKIMAFDEKNVTSLFVADAIGNNSELGEKDFYGQELKYGVPRLDFAKGQMSFPVEAKLIFREKIAGENFQSEARASTRGGVEKFFKTVDGVTGIKLNIKPGFLPVLPLLSRNITVTID